jgi:hypothetical protein
MKPLNNFKIHFFVVLMNVKGKKTSFLFVSVSFLLFPSSFYPSLSSLSFLITIHRLREQLKLQSNELLEQQKLTKELQIKFTDLQGQIIPKQFELSKILQEKNYLENEVTFIRSELTNKENQERIYRKETNEKLSSLENEILALKRSNDEKNGKIDLLTVSNTILHCSGFENLKFYFLFSPCFFLSLVCSFDSFDSGFFS